MKKIAIVGGSVVGLFLPIGRIFAQTPAYTMDPTVKTAVTDLFSSYVSTALSLLPAVLTITGGLMLTMFGYRFFSNKAKSHIKG